MGLLNGAPRAGVAAALALCIALSHVVKARRSSRIGLPPGPQETSFILGNVSDLPSPPEEWQKYHQMSKRFGPVMHLRAFNRHIVVLDTMKAAVDLLEKRGAIYSDRPRLPFIGELMGYDWNLTIMRYGGFWRLHRRALHQHLNESAVPRLHQKLERVNLKFLRALVQYPGDWWSLTHWLAGASIMTTIYGLDDTQLKDDPWIQLGEDTLQIANEVFDAGVQPVDLFPFLKCIPAWFPGASFKRKAIKARALQMRARENPFAWVKNQLAAGIAVPSITAALLDAQVDGSPISEEIIKNCTGIAYIAGADTTLSVIKSFIRAMVLHPQVQRKAQAELDRAIPPGRLPSLADRDNVKLPYLEAVLRETYRKYPPAPLGIAHKSTEDDIYEGMRIPANTIVISNIAAILQDERTFPNPSLFRPQRFLNEEGRISTDVPDPRSAVFGFGRRICPGRYFTDAEIWLTMATLLYCFDILPAIKEGEEVLPAEAVTKGAVVAPVEFECRILLRSCAKESLIA